MELKKLKIPFDNLQSEIDQTIKKEKKLEAQEEALKMKNEKGDKTIMKKVLSVAA